MLDYQVHFLMHKRKLTLLLPNQKKKYHYPNVLTLSNGLDISLRNVWYGSVTDPDDLGGNARVDGTEVSDDAVYDAKIVT